MATASQPSPPPRCAPVRRPPAIITVRPACPSLPSEPRSSSLIAPVSGSGTGENGCCPSTARTPLHDTVHTPTALESSGSPGSSLLDQVCTFLIQRSRAKEVSSSGNLSPTLVTVYREFHHVTDMMYRHIVRALSIMQNTLVDTPSAPRIDFFGDLFLLVITLPGASHGMLAPYSSFLCRTLYEQGFWWPAWGDDLGHLNQTAGKSVVLHNRGVVTELQPDAGLQFPDSNTPFLIIEVVDSESYHHSRMKAKRFLLHSESKVRFVIIIDLVRSAEEKNPQRAMEKNARKDETDRLNSGIAAGHGAVNQLPHKRAAENYNSEQLSTKKVRIDNDTPQPADPSPQPPHTHQSNPRAVYTRGLVTVLTTELILHPTIPAKQKGQPLTLIDSAEFWPSPPAEVFTFTWEDISNAHPAEVTGKTFTLPFGVLHRMLQGFVGTGQWSEQGCGKSNAE